MKVREGLEASASTGLLALGISFLEQQRLIEGIVLIVVGVFLYVWHHKAEKKK